MSVSKKGKERKSGNEDNKGDAHMDNNKGIQGV